MRNARFFAALLASALMFSGVGDLGAQGSIRGQVREEGSGRALSGAQVSVSALQLGGLTAGNGAFLLVGVPGGTHTITVQMLGYASTSQEVQVNPGETAVVNFVLRTEVLELDRIVVTGTAGVTTRRQMGNAVELIDVADVVQRAPVQSMGQLLQGRVAGASVMMSGGVGGANPIALRGFSSITRSSQPLVYIDGVRISAEAGVPTTLGQRSRGRLNDLNPAEIESVEIIKGPAASTLYGSEASNGVIQIITKQGRTGSPTFTASVSQGVQYFANPDKYVKPNYATDPVSGELIVQDLIESERALGNKVFHNGHTQNYTVDVRGGTGAIGYYASATREDDQGFLPNAWLERTAVRANVNAQAADNLRVQTGIGWTTGVTARPASSGSFNQGFIELFTWGSPLTRNDPKRRGFLQGPPEESAKIDNTIDVDRVQWNVRVEHEPTPWLSHRLIGGMESLSELYSGHYPRQPEGVAHVWAGLALGRKTVRVVDVANRTLDYSATASFNPSPEIRSATSFGFQYHTTSSDGLLSEGQNFPAVGLSTIASAAIRTTSDSFEENKSWGVYLQQRFDWRDQLFITAAVRGDDHSAFGLEIDPTIYPKLSGSWTVTDAWDLGFVDQLQLRAAWGKAGQQPSTFSAIRTYRPTYGYLDAPGLRPSNPGNPQLRPEVKSEIEVGFDAELFGGRLALEVTGFRQRTTDAILDREVPPSLGFTASQTVNIGEIANRGFEVSTTVRPVVRQGLAWELGLLVAHQMNEIIDLGGVDAGSRHQEGYPIGGFWERVPVWADIQPGTLKVSNPLCWVAKGKERAPDRDWVHGLTSAPDGAVPCNQADRQYVGPPGPNWQASLSTTLNIGQNLRIYALADGVFDIMAGSSADGARENLFTNGLRIHTLAEQAPAFIAWAKNAVNTGYFSRNRQDFVKLREVSASYRLPASWVERFRASEATLGVSGRNVARLWMHKHARDSADTDPESHDSAVAWNHSDQTKFPHATRLEMSLRVTF